MNIDLALAQQLAQGVRCPTCGGGGEGEWVTPQGLHQGGRCIDCDGKGSLFFKGEWPQLVWAKLTSGAADNWVFGLCLGPVNGALYVIYQRHDGSYRADWNHHFADYCPAPHPVDVLMKLEEWGVLEVCRTGWRWWATGSRMDTAFSDRRFADPSALLTAVLEAV